MTANQINYARQREEVRHNIRTEHQKDRDLAIGERQAASAELQAQVASRRQSEDARHNLQTEAVNWFSAAGNLSETQRHNKELESINWFDTRSQDTYRRASASAQMQQAQAARTSAAASYLGAQASMEQARVAGTNAATRQSELAESIRHNYVMESVSKEQARASTAQAKAANVQAEVSENKSTSEKFRNYAAGGKDAVSAVRGIGDLASSILRGGFR